MNKKRLAAICVFAVTALSAQTQLQLAPAANMDFMDAVEDDGKGGWTDQGPENDLRGILGTKEVRYKDFRFKILEPGKNNGHSCMVLSEKRKISPTSAVIEVPRNAKGNVLMLIHAGAWVLKEGETAGWITAEYADGSKEQRPVISYSDIGNWWNPENCRNAQIVWSGTNRSSKIGVFFSQFQFKKTPIRFRFKSNGPVMWMALCAALSEKTAEVKWNDAKYVIKANEKWFPIDFTARTKAGSALDFSVKDKPAGKKGFVILTKDGHLAFEKEPDKRIRFFGPNLVHTANVVPTHAETDIMVSEIAKMGYNTVRLHHFEWMIQNLQGNSSLEMIPEKLDRFFYLIAKLKENGIYITIDFYASRRLRPGDNIPEMKGRKHDTLQNKLLFIVNPAARENWKAYVRKLLTIKNPYTGLALIDDPVLWSANMVNENSIVWIWNRIPWLLPVLEQKYDTYLKEKGIDTPENRKNRSALFREFLLELQGKCMDEQIRFLKKELGFKGLVADLNYANTFSLVQLRDKLDIVDNHQYWDHPTFPGKKQWQPPEKHSQTSAIRNYCALPRAVMGSRLFGKPYMLTEYNFVYPNMFRHEAAPLLGGYAGLQDWDDLNRFAWTHSSGKISNLSKAVGFDCINDPAARMSEQIIRFLFLRGDVSPAKEAYAAAFQEKHKKTGSFDQTLPSGFQHLGFFARIGSLMDRRNVAGVKKMDPFEKNWRKQLSPAAQKAMDEFDKTGNIISSTGEINVNVKGWGRIKVITPKSEVFSFSGDIEGKIASFKNGYSQTVAVISRDGLPLAQSRDILIYHLSNQAMTGETYMNESMTRLLAWGKQPVLIRRSVIIAELKLPAGFRIQTLKLSGEPNGGIQAAYKDGKYRFIMDNTAKKGGVMVYHLTR